MIIKNINTKIRMTKDNKLTLVLLMTKEQKESLILESGECPKTLFDSIKIIEVQK